MSGKEEVVTFFTLGWYQFTPLLKECVRGIIEVKSKIYRGRTNNNSLYKIIEKFNSFDKFQTLNDKGRNRIFKGIFGYEFEGSVNSKIIDEALRFSNGMVNHVSLNESIFIRHWIDNEGMNPPVHCTQYFYNIYDIVDLSHAYFISNLIHMSSEKDMMNRYWLSFPIVGTKEQNRVKTICLNQ